MAEKYKELADRVVSVLEEVAKLTDNKWDDQAATVIRLLFSTFTSPIRFGADPTDVLTAAEAFPPWLLPLVPLLVELLKHLFKR